MCWKYTTNPLQTIDNNLVGTLGKNFSLVMTIGFYLLYILK